MKNAEVFLKKITEDIPPVEGERHSLVLNKEGKLTLVLMLDDNRRLPVTLEGWKDFPENILSGALADCQTVLEHYRIYSEWRYAEINGRRGDV